MSRCTSQHLPQHCDPLPSLCQYDLQYDGAWVSICLSAASPVRRLGFLHSTGLNMFQSRIDTFGPSRQMLTAHRTATRHRHARLPGTLWAHNKCISPTATCGHCLRGFARPGGAATSGRPGARGEETSFQSETPKHDAYQPVAMQPGCNGMLMETCIYMEARTGKLLYIAAQMKPARR